MPLPKRSASTRIPGSKDSHVAAERDASPTKLPAPNRTAFTGNATRDDPGTERRQLGTRSQRLNSSVELQAESRRGRNDSLRDVGSLADSRSLLPSSDHGNAGSNLVRAKSLRKPPQSAAGPPTSFRMPTRMAQSSTAMAPTQSSSSRDQARHASESSATSESRRRSSSMGSKSRRSSTSNDSKPLIPQTPRAQSRTRPPSSSSQHSKRPMSASSTSTPSYSVSRRPDFNNYQQRFNSPSKASATAADHPRMSMEQARQHVHLLHLEILHSSADRTLSEYTESARRKLHAQHNNLQDLYVTSLHLSRSVRQQRNLLALTRWTNGNIAVLERKLSTLCAILEEISRLTAPTSSQQTEVPEQVAERHEAGPYTRLTEQFTAWVSYVLEIWEKRDAAAQRENEGDTDFDEDDNFTAIEGLGDGVKATVRQLTDSVNALLLRMEDIRAVPVPDVDINQPVGNETSGERMPPTAPAVLVGYAGTLLDCMAEELQLMREVEFEVVIGEKAWVDERVRRAQADIDGGFSTPRSFRDVF